MPYYFMRDTPLQALEQLMMSQPGQKPRGGGIYRSPFHYTPKDVACEYCQNYDRKHPCRLCECTCLEERIEAGVLEMNEFVRDCFAPSMGPQLRKRMHQQLRERNPQFFLSNAHRRRWTYWRERCWRLSDRNKAALFLLTAYESLWRRMVWKCGNDGFDFQSVRLGGIEPELYSVYQAAKAIAVGCCNITLADLASPELVTDEAFHLITGALLMAKYAIMSIPFPIMRRAYMYILTFRLSIFGDYKQYAPTSANSIAWTQALQTAGYDFLPNIIQTTQQIINVPFVSAKIGSNDKRMQFVSPSGDVNIRILAERVDVEFTLGTSDTTEEYFTEKLPVASSIMDTILTTLGNVQGNRLAYYADIIIPEVEGSSFANFYQTNNLGISVNDASEKCVEWNHRFNSRVSKIYSFHVSRNGMLLKL